MTTICAWCQTVISESASPGVSGSAESHGICKNCLKTHFPAEFAIYAAKIAVEAEKERLAIVGRTDAAHFRNLSEIATKRQELARLEGLTYSPDRQAMGRFR